MSWPLLLVIKIITFPSQLEINVSTFQPKKYSLKIDEKVGLSLIKIEWFAMGIVIIATCQC